MVVLTHTRHHPSGAIGPRTADSVPNEPQITFLTRGQSDLLDHIPTSGDVIDLSAAIRIVSIGEQHAYGSIVTLMNRGLVTAEFIDAPSVDPEIVLRRL